MTTTGVAVIFFGTWLTIGMEEDMKGSSYRRPTDHNTARIVVSIQDSYLDRLIPLEYAINMFIEGQLVPVDLGPDYPNSYKLA